MQDESSHDSHHGGHPSSSAMRGQLSTSSSPLQSLSTRTIIPSDVSLASPGFTGASLAAITSAVASAAIGRVASAVAPGPLSPEESEAVLSAMTALFESLREMHLDSGQEPWKPSIKTSDGFKACKQFLCALSAAADALQIRPQSREYRNQFTKNYRALFPDQRRHYRVDVLEASQEGYTMIYVNGERFDFHSSVVESGMSFKLAWINSIGKLQQLQRHDLTKDQYWRSELVPVLVDLDCKWAEFEQEYILELIQIERKARRYVMDVISLENQLVYLDGSVATLVAKGDAVQTAHLHIWQQWQSCRRDYVKKLFRLNSIANYRRKGRGDLDLSVLETAENIIKTSESNPGHVYECVASIASSCVSSFNDFRKHITELGQTPERIDPHLCNNVTLVNHLVRVEETWELAQKYLMDTQRLRNVIHIVDFVVAVVKTQKAILAILNSSSVSSETASSRHQRLSTSGSSGSLTFRDTLVTHSPRSAVQDTPAKPAPATCSHRRSTSSAVDSAMDNDFQGSAAATVTREENEGDLRVVSSNATACTTQDMAPETTDSGSQRMLTTGTGCTVTSSSGLRPPGFSVRQRTSSSNAGDKRETLEEKLIACDVEAFLALPRFVCLYYLLDPIHRSQILQQFLPHFFAECPSPADPVPEVPDEFWGSKSFFPFSGCQPQCLVKPSCSSSSSSSSCTASLLPNSSDPSGPSFEGEAIEVGAGGASNAAVDTPRAPSMEVTGPGSTVVEGAGSAAGRGSSSAFRLLSSFSGDGASTRAPSRQEESSSSTSSFAQPSSRSSQNGCCSSSKPSDTPVPVDSDSDDASTMCDSTLRDSLNSTSALQEAGPEAALNGGTTAEVANSSGSSATTSGFPASTTMGPNLSSVPLSQKGQRIFFCSSDSDQYPRPGTASSAASGADLWTQQHCGSMRFVLSKVPTGLRKMVRAWMLMQSWLRSEGLDDSKEAWLCVIARLADSEDFKLLIQKWAGTKLSGFRQQLEALFHAVEEISMALQRSSPQDWNEFLQAIIQGIQRDSPSRSSRSVC
ncbi:phospho-2-dehydro-3-deoxyheptonate protein [Cystoisospora suis]|uniref:Phospho-2-dehydro-3-deoxyheptonate protein n=1 Tax=Cystoisospora suis TaxID=483139 RepID=A0A2C6LAU8_9APIC|nr:phospho-2-dehydro-3-deoxyheptonate protein [Cystoisospora suis]